MNTPAKVRVIFTGFNWSLHVTTVPFNMASGVTVTLRVDVRSARGGVGFAASEMSVAVKIPRSSGRSKGSFSKNLTILNAVLLHSKLTPPVTVHVRITSSLGHMAPRVLEVSVTAPSEYQHSTIQGGEGKNYCGAVMKNLVRADQNWLPKLVPPCQKWSVCACCVHEYCRSYWIQQQTSSAQCSK